MLISNQDSPCLLACDVCTLAVLTRKGRSEISSMQGDILLEHLQLVDEVKEMASCKGWESSQIALAWLHAQAAKLGVSVLSTPGTKQSGTWSRMWQR